MLSRKFECYSNTVGFHMGTGALWDQIRVQVSEAPTPGDSPRRLVDFCFGRAACLVLDKSSGYMLVMLVEIMQNQL